MTQIKTPPTKPGRFRMGIYTSPLKGISPEETGGSVAKGLAKTALAKLNDRDEMLSLRDMVEKRAVTYTSENPIEVEEYIESFRGILRGVSAYIDMGMNYSDEGSKEEIEELTAET